MGYNTTVVVLNDALGQIEKDPDFGKKLAAAVKKVSCFQHDPSFHYSMGDVSAGNHCNAATVIETHHADNTSVVLVGGNCGTSLGETYGWNHNEEEHQVRMLQDIAGKLGYDLVKKEEVSGV